MSKLFIYYSFTGNVDAVAEVLKAKGFDLRKVESEFKLSNKLFPQMMKGGFSAAIGQTPKLIGYDSDVSVYDEIVIGSPIWNGRFASPVNTILKETDLGGKKLTFILCSGSGTGKNADKKIAKLYPGANVIHLEQPRDLREELGKLSDF